MEVYNLKILILGIIELIYLALVHEIVHIHIVLPRFYVHYHLDCVLLNDYKKSKVILISNRWQQLNIGLLFYYDQ